MNIFRKLLIKARIVTPKHHERAELGQVPWGRQIATAEPQAVIRAKVTRKDGTVEDLGVITGGKK